MNAFELRSKDGKSVTIDKEWTRFGRADDNDIVVRDQAVSRYHLNFYVKDGSLIVEDAGSQNGFLVNGQLATGAVYLKAGDRLAVGTMEYAIRVPGTPETATAAPRPTGFASSFTNSAASVSLPDDPSKKRIRLYAIAAVALLLFAVLSKDKDATKKPAGTETGPDAGLSSKGYRPDSYKTMSISEIRSEAKLREAKRDYDNGNYSRAHLGFQESLTLNPENDDAKAYLQYAEEQLEKQIAELQRDANKSMENLQYRRAKSQALRILTILSEQIAGYGRKVAQDAALTPEQRRPAGQEETILEIPCNSTRNEKACKDALDMIREARRRLGEEDALR